MSILFESEYYVVRRKVLKLDHNVTFIEVIVTK